MAKKKGTEEKKQDAKQDTKKKLFVTAPTASIPGKNEIKEIPNSILDKFDKLCKNLNDKFGDEDDPVIYDEETANMVYTTNVIPTGLPFVDVATGIGGIPDNAIIELYGPQSSGKSFIAQCAMAMSQRHRGLYCVYADLEGGLERERMDILGIDRSKVKFINQGVCGEDLFDMMYTFIESGTVGMIVVDSVAAIKSGLLDEMTQREAGKQVGVVGRLMSNGLRKLAGLVKKYRVPVIFVNQLRDKIGVMYGPSTTTPGGNALKYYAQFRMEVKPYFDKSGRLPSKIMNPTDPTEQIGQRSQVKMVKNKFAPPNGEGMFEIYFKKSDPILEVIQKAKTAKLWFVRNGVNNYNTAEGTRISQESFDDFIRDLVVGDYITELTERIMEKQENGEIEVLLGSDFDLETLHEAIGVAQASYATPNPVDGPPEGFELPKE